MSNPEVAIMPAYANGNSYGGSPASGPPDLPRPVPAWKFGLHPVQR